MAIQDFTLVENALDSLEHAIEHLNAMPDRPNTGTFKRVILDLAHVAELLLKERLRQIHPAFVLSDVDKFPSRTAHTVTATDALRRLQKIGGVEFEDSDQSALRTILEKRNEIEHYAFSFNRPEVKIVIGNVLVFIFRFATDELGLDWSDRRITDPNWKRLNQYAEFYEIEKARVLSVLEGSDLPTTECPTCGNKTFDMEAEVCVLCGHREAVLECEVCRARYLHSNVEHEEAGLCKKCEWEDGYAAANFEKY